MTNDESRRMQFDVSVLRRGEGMIETQKTVGEHELTILDGASGSALAALDIRFEDAVEAMSRLPRMFVEPDGSFVCVGGDAEQRWQLDGVIYDRDGSIVRVEVKGSCPEPALDELLSAFGWPNRELMFELTRAGVVVDEESFRAMATSRETE